jgi:hypothetical protein
MLIKRMLPISGCGELLIGAYSLLDGFATDITVFNWGGGTSNWVYGGICGSEAYKGSTLDDLSESATPLELFTATPQNEFIAPKMADSLCRCSEGKQRVKGDGPATDIQLGTGTASLLKRGSCEAFIILRPSKCGTNSIC